jgi:flagellin-like hook-associated protein FlgL
MPIVLNTNASATEATFNLSNANDNLRKSIARLSSGNRITKPTDDAGGMAVAYKLQSSVKRTEANINNHQNALSFLQVQDGVLEAIGEIVDRMAELRTMAADVSKNTADIENYSKEFLELQEQLNQMKREKFNGVELFATEKEWARMQGINKDQLIVNGSDYKDWNGTDASIGTRQTYEYFDNAVAADRTLQSYDKYEFELFTHPSGDPDDGNIKLNMVNLQMLLSIKDPSEEFGLSMSSMVNTDATGGVQASIATGKTVNLGGLYTWNNTADTEPFSITAPGTDIYNGTNDTLETGEFDRNNFVKDITKISVEEFTNIIEKIADARAENGAEQQRVNQSMRLQQNNLVNLEAAHGRIVDVDVALESTRLARHSVKVQASAAMVAQANQMTSVALTLLQ